VVVESKAFQFTVAMHNGARSPISIHAAKTSSKTQNLISDNRMHKEKRDVADPTHIRFSEFAKNDSGRLRVTTVTVDAKGCSDKPFAFDLFRGASGATRSSFDRNVDDLDTGEFCRPL